MVISKCLAESSGRGQWHPNSGNLSQVARAARQANGADGELDERTEEGEKGRERNGSINCLVLTRSDDEVKFVYSQRRRVQLRTGPASQQRNKISLVSKPQIQISIFTILRRCFRFFKMFDNSLQISWG